MFVDGDEEDMDPEEVSACPVAVTVVAPVLLIDILFLHLFMMFILFHCYYRIVVRGRSAFES